MTQSRGGGGGEEPKECIVELGGRDEAVKDRFMEIYKEEKRKVKRYIYQSKRKYMNSLEGR